MLYEVEIKGRAPIIMHNGAAGLDTRSPEKLEMAAIAAKRGSNRTASDEGRLRELETTVSLWLSDKGLPTIPEAALRTAIEEGARKVKQGPNVREGLIVSRVLEFVYDKSLGTSVEELSRNVQFTVPVVVQRSRILRTRAKFDDWGCRFEVDCDDELVDKTQLLHWLNIAGQRIGIGDWRPSKSGIYGRFEVLSVESK